MQGFCRPGAVANGWLRRHGGEFPCQWSISLLLWPAPLLWFWDGKGACKTLTIERERVRERRERERRELNSAEYENFSKGWSNWAMHVEVIGRAPVVVLHVALAGRPSPKSACIEFLKIKIKCVILPHRGFKKKYGLIITPIEKTSKWRVCKQWVALRGSIAS